MRTHWKNIDINKRNFFFFWECKQKKLIGMKDISFFNISRNKFYEVGWKVGKWMSVSHRVTFSGKEKRTESVSQRWLSTVTMPLLNCINYSLKLDVGRNWKWKSQILDIYISHEVSFFSSNQQWIGYTLIKWKSESFNECQYLFPKIDRWKEIQNSLLP